MQEREISGNQQAKEKSPKRLQAETTVNCTGQAAAKLDALLPAILDKAFKAEL